MMTSTRLIAIVAILGATAALAHQGVQNPAVKARMDGMSVIAAAMKGLGAMAKGEASFDADLARQNAADVAREAARIPILFKANEDDPKSEAKPGIWTSFDDFALLAAKLEQTAHGAAAKMDTIEGVRAALRSMGQTCKACHETYRE